MQVVSKTYNGYVVHLSMSEVMNLTGLDLYYANHLKDGQEVEIKNLKNAVHMAETIQFNRDKIVKSLEDMIEGIKKIPLHQFSNTVK